MCLVRIFLRRLWVIATVRCGQLAPEYARPLRQKSHPWLSATSTYSTDFGATVTSNGSSCPTWRLSVLSVCYVGVLWPNGRMDQDVTWYGGRPRPSGIVLDRDPAFPTERGTAAATFRPMTIVAKGPFISATAEVLLIMLVENVTENVSNQTMLCCYKLLFFSGTRAVQPVATCRQSPYLHKPAVAIVTSISLWRHSHCDIIRYWAGHTHRYGRTYVRYVRTPYRV